MTLLERAADMKAVWPLLMVKEMARSIAFYRDGLGFEIAGEAKGDEGEVFWCRVARGGASVMLQQACAEDGPVEGRGRGVALYVMCEDVDALYAEWKKRGVRMNAPTAAPYGMKQLKVQEPDGYDLWFESPVAAAAGTEDGGESE
jgi:uncharacterized glyoxalase superfamily protein PhnB